MIYHNVMCYHIQYVNISKQGGDGLSISYNKLWKLLVDKKINKTELRKSAGISTNVIAKLGKDEPVSMETMTKICAALNCDIGDIMEILNAKEEQPQ